MLIFVSVISLLFLLIIRVSFSPCDAATSQNDSYINGILLHGVTVNMVYHSVVRIHRDYQSEKFLKFSFPFVIYIISNIMYCCNNVIQMFTVKRDQESIEVS